MDCVKCAKETPQIMRLRIVTKPPQVMRATREEEVSIRAILQTLTWGEVLDVLLGTVMMWCLMIGLILAFGE